MQFLTMALAGRPAPWLAFVLIFIANAASAAVLTLGSLSEAPGEEINTFLPFARHMAAGLHQQGVIDARVVVRKNPAEMAELMKRGEVDLFIDSSLSVLKVQRLSGGNFLARRWKNGLAEYRSLIFVRQESPVKRLADLAGHSIAFEEAFSTSGFLLPAEEIYRQGLKLIPAQEGNPAKAVGYHFTHGEENTLMWVLGGRVTAGALAEFKFARLAAPVAGELRVIHHSKVMPYHLVLARPGLPDALRAAIHARLISMHESPEGQKALLAFEKTTRFDDIPSASLQNLRNFKLDF